MQVPVKRPTKVEFVSQRAINEKNRLTREQVLRILDERQKAFYEVAAANEFPKR